MKRKTEQRERWQNSLMKSATQTTAQRGKPVRPPIGRMNRWLTIEYVYPLPESQEISEEYVKRAMPILQALITIGF
jgi:hypothetical protein